MKEHFLFDKLAMAMTWGVELALALTPGDLLWGVSRSSPTFSTRRLLVYAIREGTCSCSDFGWFVQYSKDFKVTVINTKRNHFLTVTVVERWNPLWISLCLLCRRGWACSLSWSSAFVCFFNLFCSSLLAAMVICVFFILF